jgi:GTPase SAR1 family protein
MKKTAHSEDEIKYTVALIGGRMVGKSSISTRFVLDEFFLESNDIEGLFNFTT